MDSPLDITFGASISAFLDTAEDFHKHRKRINRRIRRLRHDLNIVTGDTKNYKDKEQQTKISQDDYAKDSKYGLLLLLTSERDYAYSRELKYLMEIGNESAGSYKNLMLSRIKRSLHNAKKLLEVSQAEQDQLVKVETYVYTALIQGIYSIHKKQWEGAVNALSIARCGLECIYQQHQNKLQEQDIDSDDEKFYIKELLDSIVDSSLNLAVSQLDTVANSDFKSISRKHCKDGKFPYLSPAVDAISAIDAQYVTELSVIEGGEADDNTVIKSIQWRDHEAAIVNEEIAIKIMKLNKLNTSKFKANDFDEKLVNQWSLILDLHENDSTNKDEDDLDLVQSRAILSTYLQYQELFSKLKRDLLFIEEVTSNHKASSSFNKLELNKDTYWLLNAITSTVQSLKDLPGVYNDEDLYKSLENLEKYYVGQKYIKLADSFAVNESFAEALRLYSHIKEEVLPQGTRDIYSVDFPYSVTNNDEYTQFYADFTKMFSQIHILAQFAVDLKSPTSASTIIENVNKYPINLKLDNLINLNERVKIEPILTKPVLFDIGFNYINYNSDRSKGYESTSSASSAPGTASTAAGTDESKKSGFFGIFGRS
ncbi:signal recognition particle subunit Srp68p [[Candida] railenensis]|uniref:Signal recognition particle subunit SRP68 n=1 Tax=[Candida] railenensis TaxID=45579 RepID=A0A9P0QSP5_9ASCO|nr:signal recognition particle subunit Srp68p [[Candida] railenensis]